MNPGKPIDLALVCDFVTKAHGDLEAVRKLLEAEPGLLHASWHWGNGDWETALGAAAHVGRKDIARVLLERGARLDIFAAAMLDDLATVRAILELQPAARSAPGPHGIPMIAHAQAGQAMRVIEYLKSLGG
jgi:hypothetical protein